MNYVIINADTLQKRIDELEKSDEFFSQGSFGEHKYLIQLLLSNSIPLVPEIEKAINFGNETAYMVSRLSFNRHEYISQLQLKLNTCKENLNIKEQVI